MEQWRNDMENRSDGGKTCPSAASYTVSLTWTGLGSNPAIGGEGRRLSASAMSRPLRTKRRIVFLSCLDIGRS
jgi:hypothetical protein